MSKHTPRKAFARPVSAAPEPLNPADLPSPAPLDAGPLAAQPLPDTAPCEIDDDDDPRPPAFDINGFDPNDFEWRPVPRRPRADGWTPEVQRAFIEALADTGMVEAAAEAVNMSVRTAYRLRNAPGSESFARAWTIALAHAANRLVDIAFQRAIEGVDTPVFDRDGCRIGSKRHYSDRLTMFILRAYLPDRFRHAHRDVRGPGEAPPLPAEPLAPALAALTPVAPADPHLLMPPERLESLVDGARGMEELYELYPDLDRKKYQRRTVEPNHPAAHVRRRLRYARERGRTEADNALLAQLDGEARGEDDES